MNIFFKWKIKFLWDYHDTYLNIYKNTLKLGCKMESPGRHRRMMVGPIHKNSDFSMWGRAQASLILFVFFLFIISFSFSPLPPFLLLSFPSFFMSYPHTALSRASSKILKISGDDVYPYIGLHFKKKAFNTSPIKDNLLLFFK